MTTPQTEDCPVYYALMAKETILWANVRALMLSRYGKENITKLAREAKVGPATVQGIKNADRTVRVKTLEKISKWGKLEPWQLIAPGMDDVVFLDLLQAMKDVKFREMLNLWQAPDGVGRRMLFIAIEGAKTHYEIERTQQDVGTVHPEGAAKVKRG